MEQSNPLIMTVITQSVVSLITLCLLFLSSCSDSRVESIERLDGSEITTDSLSTRLNELIRNAQVHGIAVSVFSDNIPVYQKTFGYKNHLKELALTDSTNIYGASFSKAVFSVLVMRLVEEGWIDLDTPLESVSYTHLTLPTTPYL